jgi:hypothetical protein
MTQSTLPKTVTPAPGRERPLAIVCWGGGVGEGTELSSPCVCVLREDDPKMTVLNVEVARLSLEALLEVMLDVLAERVWVCPTHGPPRPALELGKRVACMVTNDEVVVDEYLGRRGLGGDNDSRSTQAARSHVAAVPKRKNIGARSLQGRPSMSERICTFMRFSAHDWKDCSNEMTQARPRCRTSLRDPRAARSRISLRLKTAHVELSGQPSGFPQLTCPI